MCTSFHYNIETPFAKLNKCKIIGFVDATLVDADDGAEFSSVNQRRTPPMHMPMAETA